MNAVPARRRREYTLVLALITVGAAGLLAATGRPWARAAVEVPGPLAPAPIVVQADLLSPTAAALGWACLAALAAVVATRGVARRLVGVLIALFGVVALVDLWRGTRPGHIVEVAAGVATAEGDVTTPVTEPLWPWIGAVAALLLVAVGLLTAVRGAAWPAMSSRYDRHSAPRAASTGDPADLWKSFDSGADPTADPSRDPDACPDGATGASGTTASDDNADSKER
ncbi:Trp biosynthesis-associated membrane protein [Marinactinospora thermotolerans]|uniref:Trp region conserved hypothetical membrane protein n=1 Tax=Marinactinospora thermotolerans DSM 45154 TaxID=1122192 RepID=A0A1T4KS54_9ACTN|nr:Trp biosynthesis-associated membrane protein [Marinactinospora thermotolerans]SJZ45262.1 trp region conserved hypothetical membrane protein [Marinactinospora thermotolerans DSM 45154]